MLVLWHASEADPSYLRMRLQVLSECHRVFAVTLKAQREGLQTEKKAPRVERALAAAEVAEAFHPAANGKANVHTEGPSTAAVSQPAIQLVDQSVDLPINQI